jgi:hypothetical protein
MTIFDIEKIMWHCGHLQPSQCAMGVAVPLLTVHSSPRSARLLGKPDGG